jgi:hypothetical protein
MPLMDRLPKVAALLERAPKENSGHMEAYFSEHLDKGALSEGFDIDGAISLMQNLSATMIMQARSGAPLDALLKKSVRNTELVLYEGQGGPAG